MDVVHFRLIRLPFFESLLMTNYCDPIYGEVALDELVMDFVSQSPELLRLRLVGMMNFKSIEMLPLTSVSRLEHTLGLAYLAHICVANNPEILHWKNDLLVAALYHDVNCGSFGHSVEWAIDRHSSYTHEQKAAWVKESDTLSSILDKPIFLEQDGLHRFGFRRRYNLDFKRINGLINGEASYVINNIGIDLDNIDSVFRMAHYLGISPTNTSAVELVSRLKIVPGLDNFAVASRDVCKLGLWRQARTEVYKKFIYCREYMGFEFLIFELINEHAKLVENDGLQNLFHYTDENLLWSFYNSTDSTPVIRNLAKRVLLQDLPICISIIRTDEFGAKEHLSTGLAGISETITARLRSDGINLVKPVKLHLTTDDRKTSRAIPIYVEEGEGYRCEVLGDDRSFLLIAILIEKIDSSIDPAPIVNSTIGALAQEGFEGFERVDFFEASERSDQFALL